ncbi:MAG TPA: response regulator transcription factor [Cyclobacteriaceae bacterium]|nr:response regulator transcription factor [Cyclobacteriaceae bacterium]
MRKINILLVEDEALVRQGLRALLEREDFIRYVFEAGNAREFRQAISEHQIDLILLDMKLPGVRGMDLIGELNRRQDRPSIIVVTGFDGVELMINLLKSGVSGIVFKLDGYSEVLKTILEVCKSGHYYQERVSRLIQEYAHYWEEIPPVSLSFQENELLRIIASGATTKEMALQLKMTEATTETYRTRLIRKIGVPNTAALIAYAFKNGIL